jgi:glycosyltransferase involved in cell wall biosynthesis
MTALPENDQSDLEGGVVSTPLASIVVATHNRRDRLAMLFQGLREQTAGADTFEVIVVDDGSGDGTPQVLEQERQRGELRLKYHVRPVPGGPASARNMGWQSASAPLIVFTDDDVVPTPGWLEAILQVSRPEDNVLVQGPTRPLPSERHLLGPFSRTVDISGPTPHYETCNIAYPRALLEQLGGFDESYPSAAGEDSDLGWRAVAAGAELRFAPAALVHHAVHARGPLAAMKDIRLAGEGVQAYKLNPGLREYLPQKVFYRRSHALFLEAALAVALARRTPATLAFAVPYLLHVRSRARQQGATTAQMAFYPAYDAAEIVATVRGAIRHRVPIV